MLNYRNFTTDFYKPETTEKLRQTGCRIVRREGLVKTGFRYDEWVLVGMGQEPYLTGNIHWITHVAAKAGIPIHGSP